MAGVGFGESGSGSCIGSRLASNGVVARRQLVALGFGEEAIKLRLDVGRLTSLHAEVYLVGHSQIGRHGYRWAGVLAYGDGALLSHRSAAALWGLARQRGSVVEITAPAGRQGIERRKWLWIHRCKLHADDRTEEAGIPVTTVARTLFDFAEVDALWADAKLIIELDSWDTTATAPPSRATALANRNSSSPATARSASPTAGSTAKPQSSRQRSASFCASEPLAKPVRVGLERLVLFRRRDPRTAAIAVEKVK